MPFEFFENAYTADIGFRAWGESREEMFSAAADATMNVMVEDLEQIKDRIRRSVAMVAESVEMLLFDFLQELIFYKDAEQLLLRVPEITIREQGDDVSLTAMACGEKLDAARHDLIVDVKAVTMHHYEVQDTGAGWQAVVVLDI